MKFVTWLSVLLSSCPYSPMGPLPGPFFLLEISLWNGCFFRPAAQLSSWDCLHPCSVFNSLFSGSFAYCSLLVTLLYLIAFKKNTLDIIVKILSSLKVFVYLSTCFIWLGNRMLGLKLEFWRQYHLVTRYFLEIWYQSAQHVVGNIKIRKSVNPAVKTLHFSWENKKCA